MLRDLRFALRTFQRNPGFAVVAILSLALGIGANGAIFSMAEYLLLRPLPVPHASGIVVVQAQLRGESAGTYQQAGLSYPDFVDLQRKSKSFAGLTASQYFPFGIAPDKTTLPKMKYGALVSGNFFSVLGVSPALGRSFRADEDEVPGRDAVVVLGHDFWETEFASSPDVVGKSIFLNGLPFTVVGVAPEPFRGPMVWIRADLYVPLAMQPALAGSSQPNELEMRGLRVLTIQGRLKPRVSVRQAAAEASVIGQQLAQAYPATNRTCSLEVGTYWQTQIEQYSVPARGVPLDDGAGRSGVAHRLRQHHEPDAEPRLRPFARDRPAAGRGSGPGPADPAAADGEPGDRAPGRRAGTPYRPRVRESVFPIPHPQRHACGTRFPARRSGAAVRVFGFAGKRHLVWAGPGARKHQAGPAFGFKVRRRRSQQAPPVPGEECPGDRAGGGLAFAAGLCHADFSRGFGPSLLLVEFPCGEPPHRRLQPHAGPRFDGRKARNFIGSCSIRLRPLPV